MTETKREVIYQLKLMFTNNDRQFLDKRIADNINKYTKQQLIEFRQLGHIKAFRRLIKPV